MDEPAEVTPSPAQIPIRVFLLDDHDVVRRGIADLISTDPGITVVGEARTALEALHAFRLCARTLRFSTPGCLMALASTCAGASVRPRRCRSSW